MFSTMAHALADFGLTSDSAAKAEDARIERAERKETRKRVEEARERKAEREAARAARAAKRDAAEDRNRFARAAGRLDADEMILVRGEWLWREGRHAGKPVGAKALRRRLG